MTPLPESWGNSKARDFPIVPAGHIAPAPFPSPARGWAGTRERKRRRNRERLVRENNAKNLSPGLLLEDAIQARGGIFPAHRFDCSPTWRSGVADRAPPCREFGPRMPRG